MGPALHLAVIDLHIGPTEGTDMHKRSAKDALGVATCLNKSSVFSAHFSGCTTLVQIQNRTSRPFNFEKLDETRPSPTTSRKGSIAECAT
jgi:hypothetical protein